MARRSLRPHLNQIRGWVRQGRTDAWIAHQLEATVQQIETFKRDNELTPVEAENGDAPGVDFDDEIDLRAEDDALVAAELEAAEARKAEEDRLKAEEDRLKAEEDARRAEAGEDEGDGEDGETPARATPRRRGRRGGRGRAGVRSATSVLEGTFDHGEEGYGLWLDPAVTDNPIYAEHWAGHRPVEVTIEEDQIVIRRGAADGED
jgi:hypothetical protein